MVVVVDGGVVRGGWKGGGVVEPAESLGELIEPWKKMVVLDALGAQLVSCYFITINVHMYLDVNMWIIFVHINIQVYILKALKCPFN